jgi:hypothetical protein
MREAKFKIGDRVAVSAYSLEGEVTDAMHSMSTGWSYSVRCKQGDFFFRENDLELVSEKKDYSMTIQIDIANNVVIATLFEESGDIKSSLAKGHGHLIHEGELGIAQAASFACKRLYESLGGTLTKGGSWR